MKVCPQCDRTYADESISFCLADGQLLSAPYRAGVETEPLQPRATNAPQTLILPPALSRDKARSIIRRNWIIAAVSVPVGGLISLIQFSTLPGKEDPPASVLAFGAVIGGLVWGYFGWSAAWGYPAVWRWWRNFARRVFNWMKETVNLNAVITALVVLFGLLFFAPVLAAVFLYFYSLFLVGLAYSLFGGGIYQFISTRKVAASGGEAASSRQGL